MAYSEWRARTNLASRHLLGRIRRSGPRFFGYFLLALSFVLFAMILFPVMFQRLPVVGYWPRIQRVHGVVSHVVAQGGRFSREPVPNVTVRVGGFSAVTDGLGRYSIVFPAHDTRHVPVVLVTGSDTVVREMSFGDKEYSTQLDAALP